MISQYSGLQQCTFILALVSLQVNCSLADLSWVALFQAVIQLCLAPDCGLGSGLLHVYLF